jgi:hypothetical protein
VVLGQPAVQHNPRAAHAGACAPKAASSFRASQTGKARTRQMWCRGTRRADANPPPPAQPLHPKPGRCRHPCGVGTSASRSGRQCFPEPLSSACFPQEHACDKLARWAACTSAPTRRVLRPACQPCSRTGPWKQEQSYNETPRASRHPPAHFIPALSKCKAKAPKKAPEPSAGTRGASHDEVHTLSECEVWPVRKGGAMEGARTGMARVWNDLTR